LLTEEEILNTISKNKVPKSELDSFWSYFFGFSIIGISFITSLFTLLKASTTSNIIIFFVVSFLLIFLIYFYKIDRNLKAFHNQFNSKQNVELVEKALLHLNWKFEKNSSMFFCKELIIFGMTGFHLMIFPLDNKVLYNLRNIGSSKGRLPFLYGLETLQCKNFESALKNFA